MSLFRNGRNQAVRVPRDFELPGEEALLDLAVVTVNEREFERVPGLRCENWLR